MLITRTIRRRINVALAMFTLLLGVVVIRLFDLQVLKYDHYTQVAHEQSLGNLLTLPVRGKILDRHLNPLAESIDTQSIVMATANFDPASQSLKRVTDVLDLNFESLSYAAMARQSRLTYLKRKLMPEELTQFQNLVAQQDLRASGIFLIPDTKRFYPQRYLASQLLGFTGLDERGYDNHGLEGLEFHYDQYLRGQAEQHAVPMDARRNSLNSWELEVKNAGHNLILTLDKNIQYMVERELETTFQDEGARHAVVIVMNPHTGELLAMSSYPDFNPNNFADYPAQYYKNLAITWDYEPGSTFKVIQTAAAFEEGLLSPSDLYNNRDRFVRPTDLTLEERKKAGYLSVEDILVKSNNLGAMKISEQIGEKRLYEYMKRFGFGDLTGVDLPGEVSGTVREVKDWSSISLQSISIGQEISTTPLQMARAYSVIANGGMLYTPYIVREIQKMDGTPVLRVEPTKVRRVISPQTAQLLRDILTKVVDRGTGTRAAVKGYSVAGKTGTSQKFDRLTGDYSSTNLVTSFIGFAPADYPQVVIAAIIDEPANNEWGGTVAAPLFQRIVERVLPYLDIPPEEQGRELVAWFKP